MIFDHENYWQFYGLKQPPFSPLADVSANYLPPRWEQLFDALHHLCRTSNSLLVMTGIKQSGKSTFARLFINQLDDTIIPCVINGSKEIGAIQFQSALMQAFPLSDLQGDTLEEQLYFHLANLQHRSQLCLLVIDNAHTLPQETLKLLFYLIHQQSDAQMRLHILLLGLPELKNQVSNVNEQSGAQEMVHYFELGLLSLEETRCYLQHCLKVADLPAGMPLNDAAIANIYHSSQGRLHEINLNAEKTLIARIKTDHLSALLDFGERNKTRIIGCLILLVIMTSLSLLGSSMKHNPIVAHLKNEFFKPGIAHTTTKENFTRPKLAQTKLQPVKENKKFESKLAIVPNVNTTLPPFQLLNPQNLSNYENQMLTFSEVSPIRLTLQLNTSLRSNMTPIHSNKFYYSSLEQHYKKFLDSRWSVIKKTSLTHNQYSPVTEKFFNLTTLLPDFVWGTTFGGVQIAAQPLIFDSSWKLIRSTKQDSSVSTLRPQQQPKEIQPTKSAVIKVSTNKIGAQLRSKPTLSASNQKSATASSEQFTLQLIGLSNKKALDIFVEKNKLGQSARYYEGRLRGKEWHVLLYGKYASREEANAALQQLPQALRNEKPWVRTMSSVQASLRQQQNLYANLTK